MTTYRINFGKVGDTYPVPELTLADNGDDTAFHRAVAEHAIPHLRPVLESLGHPEFADCFFRTSPDRTYGEFMWLDLVGGEAARFCAARITAEGGAS